MSVSSGGAIEPAEVYGDAEDPQDLVVERGSGDVPVLQQGRSFGAVVDPVWHFSTVKRGSPVHLSPERRRVVLVSQRKSSERLYPRGHNAEQLPVFCSKRLHEDSELRGLIQYEGWKAPVYTPGLQSNTLALSK